MSEQPLGNSTNGAPMRVELTRAVQAWGYEGAGLTPHAVTEVVSLLAARFPAADLTPRRAIPLDAVPLPPSRLTPPDALAPICATGRHTRLLHALGRSYTDLVRALGGDFAYAPDVVALPRSEAEVDAVLEWCAQVGAQCVPFGGGTSVVGGVEARSDDRPIVTLQLRRLDQVLDVDAVSGAARIQAGAVGPVIEEQLRPHGLTLRFFPQSFELSTLGGWIATRAGGHYATGPTHIDDFVQALTALTPVGRWESRRVPSSGAGPSPDRLLCGSEGTLGVITEAWMRVSARPRFRTAATLSFASFSAGASAVREVARSGLQPSNCRLLDPNEALLNGVGDGQDAFLLLGFESPTIPVEHFAAAALALCRDLGGEPVEARQSGQRGQDEAATWREAFLRAPYLRDVLISHGVLVETFETAVTWDRLETLVEAVIDVCEAAAVDVCGDGVVTCRLTHAYPDGAAPYFTVIAPARRGSEAAQWAEIKQAAGDAVLAEGGTITHHHAVGRDHRPWYDRQRPEPFAAALSAAKAAVDPAGILNPGALLGTSPPPRPTR